MLHKHHVYVDTPLDGHLVTPLFFSRASKQKFDGFLNLNSTCLNLPDSPDVVWSVSDFI